MHTVVYKVSLVVVGVVACIVNLGPVVYRKHCYDNDNAASVLTATVSRLYDTMERQSQYNLDRVTQLQQQLHNSVEQ